MDLDPAGAPPPLGWSSAVLRCGIALTIFLSAFLLFQVQPLVSKSILPWFGGTAGVWTICLLLFQLLLLVGYAFAHVGLRWLTPPQWLVVQLALLAVAVARLPIVPDPGWRPAAATPPEGRIVLILLATIGLPFLMLSTTGPMLQAWFARTQPGRSPYRLYALSNAGSLLALASYPFLFEVYWTVPRQAAFWSIGFAVFALLYGFCMAAMVWVDRRVPRSGTAEGSAANPQADSEPPPTWGRWSTWFVLAAIPSAMLVATTNQVCLDIASVPFLWVLPLSLYLLSFILCFESERWTSRWFWATAVLVASAGMLVGLVWDAKFPIIGQVFVFFAGLFAAAMFCHSELSRARPAPRYLTSFYLALAAGGAAGGVAVGLIAPLLFPTYWEMQLGILATLIAVVVACFPWRRGKSANRMAVAGWFGSVTALVGIGIWMANDITNDSKFAIVTLRNFYGVLRVKEYDRGRPNHSIALLNGRILHGDQTLSPERRKNPTTYYSRQSGIGQVLTQRGGERPLRVGVVGLGVGTLAAYGRAGDQYRFYEINPAVEAIARNVFTYLSDCPGEIQIRLGDARLLLEAEQSDGTPLWDILAIDAFSGDAIPTHLLTREAVEVYFARLQPDGLLCLHISNRHFELTDVVAGLVQELGLAVQLVVNANDRENDVTSATWAILARSPDSFQQLELQDVYEFASSATVLWTDDYCNPFQVLRAFGGQD